MFRKKAVFYLLPLVIGAMTSAQSVAFEPIPGNVFQAACKESEKIPNSSDSKNRTDICRAFILGYIAAARQFYLNTDEKEDFHLRAIETRAKGLLHRDNRLQGNRFCIPASEPLESIISKINGIELENVQTESAVNVVELVLDAYYTCSD